MCWLPHPVLLVRAAVASVLAAAVAYTVADPDLWGHVLFGRDIVTTGSLPSTDLYSFTSDRPWINHEWAAEVLMYASFAALGSTGLLALKLAIVTMILIFVHRSLRARGVSSVVGELLLVLVVLGLLERIAPVRPQLFSLLLFTVLLLLITRIDRGGRSLLFAIPLVLFVWVNLHGGWLVGAATLGVWVGLGIVSSAMPVADRGLRIAIALAAALATLVNPYGIGMWRFLNSTVELGRVDITEWQPIYHFPHLLIPWIAGVAATIAVLRRGRQQVPLSHLGVVVMLGMTSFRVSRLDAFFVLSVALLLGPALSTLWQGTDRPPHRRSSVPALGRLVAAVAASAIIISAVAFTARNGSCIRMTTGGLPEPEVAQFIKTNDLSGKLLTWFDWGQYAIWHFAPTLRVSMDGRRETVYSEQQVFDHLRLYFDAAETGRMVRKLNPDYVWLPRDLPAADALAAANWHQIYDGPRSIVLATTPHPAVRPTPLTDGARCFPGP